MEDKNRLCPVEKASSLDAWWRRLLQNPNKILKPYIREGMTTLDIGCGPGFFTIEMARLVGDKGRVIAIDLQQGMLDIVKAKTAGASLESRITLHKCEADTLNLTAKADFALCFYMVHETPDMSRFLKQVYDLLCDGGHLLIVEPKFHVGVNEFADTLTAAESAGFRVVSLPKLTMSRSAYLEK
jgi:ubiquinone/menaquinone biosynthesis C-methylase UbiE